MIVKTILSPQFSVMLPASLIATSLPPFSQCGQLPSLNFLFSPIFLEERRVEARSRIVAQTGLKNCMKPILWSQSPQIHLPQLSQWDFRQEPFWPPLCFNHTLSLLQWSKKSVTGAWGIFRFCASRFIAWASTSSPRAQFISYCFLYFLPSLLCYWHFIYARLINKGVEAGTNLSLGLVLLKIRSLCL